MARIAYVVNVDWYFKLHWLNRALAAKANGYDIVVITHFTSAETRDYFEEIGFTCIELSFSRSGVNPFFELSTLLKLYNCLKGLKPNLVHCITVKPSVYGGLISNRLKLPSIKSITGLGAVFSSKSLTFRLLKPVVIGLYYLVGNSKQGAFIFENKSDLNIFRNARIGRNQQLVHIAGAGVDTSHFYEVSTPLNSLGSEQPLVVLFAARLLKDKGLDTLISAIEQVKSKGINVELWVAGLFDLDSKNAYTKCEIKRLANDGVIKWLGAVASKEMPSILNSVDIVALPTRYGEGIPRILIEAGATARVVLASNVSGCNELISDKVNGRLLEPLSVEEWSECIVDVVSRPLTYQYYAKSLLNEVTSQYSDEVVIGRFLALYDSHCSK
ncbi:glycosyltransferase family 4 protein [Vibrio cyclitrophicus]